MWVGVRPRPWIRRGIPNDDVRRRHGPASTTATAERVVLRPALAGRAIETVRPFVACSSSGQAKRIAFAWLAVVDPTDAQAELALLTDGFLQATVLAHQRWTSAIRLATARTNVIVGAITFLVILNGAIAAEGAAGALIRVAGLAAR